jgi:hypothetical protein
VYSTFAVLSCSVIRHSLLFRVSIECFMGTSCPSVCPSLLSAERPCCLVSVVLRTIRSAIKLENGWKDFNYIWYLRYAIEGHSKLILHTLGNTNGFSNLWGWRMNLRGDVITHSLRWRCHVPVVIRTIRATIYVWPYELFNITPSDEVSSAMTLSRRMIRDDY